MTEPAAPPPHGGLVLGDRRRFSPTREAVQWWLLDPAGEAVAYIQVIHDPSRSRVHAAPLMVCDIEVRSDVRGRGWARAIIAAVEAEYGDTLHTTGSFTPLGFAALSAHVPCEPGAAPQASCPDMTFVEDWVQRWPKYWL